MLRRVFDKVIATTGAWGPLPLRLALGAVFLAHGSQKLFGAFYGPGLAKLSEIFADKLGMTPGWLWASLAAGGEFFGGLLVLLGLVTRFGALNLVVIMAVGVVKAHWGHFFLEKGGMEYAMTCLAGSLTLLVTGGGALSIDRVLMKRRASTGQGMPRP